MNDIISKIKLLSINKYSQGYNDEDKRKHSSFELIRDDYYCELFGKCKYTFLKDQAGMTFKITSFYKYLIKF